MADATPNRVGQINASGASDALFLKKFGGEVMTAYDIAKKLKPTVRVRTIDSGKSAQFPATYRVGVHYHTPGAELLGQSIKHNEVVVTLDDLLIADVFVAKIDELKNHYDVRAPYGEEIGRALALFEDRTIAQSIIKSARGSELFSGDGGGSYVAESTVGGSADFTTSGSDLISALNLAKQKMDEKNVPVETMPVHSVFLPAQFYLIANSDKNINRDYNGGANSLASTRLKTVSDINVYKSNAPLFGKDVTTYHASTNTDGVVKSAGGTYSTATTAEDALPNDYPSKYQLDLTNTAGAVWCEPAVAYLQLLGLNMETVWDARRRGTLILAEMAIGMDALRSKCAVELKKD